MDISTMESDDIRNELEALGISLHHKTGIDKLRSTLEQALNGDVPTEDITDTATASLDNTVKRLTADEHVAKLTKEQRALRMQRIVVTPNDPLLSTRTGMIFTVGSSAVNKGKMIKKFVPFNNDDGWHVPQIIIDLISAAEMQKFKTVTRHDNSKVLEPYITKKFNVQVLPPLTTSEMESLAAAQQATRIA